MGQIREKVFISKLNMNLFINKLSLADEERFEEKFGMEKLQKAFSMDDHKNDFPIILSAFWEMLDHSDKKKILANEYKYFDGTEEKTLSKDDPLLILKAVISGADELEGIVLGMVRTFLAARPDKQENDKKKVTVG